MRLRSLALVAALAACNMTKFAADQTADVLQVAAPSLNMESDPELARDAAPGQLKTVEGFFLASPGNKKLIRILAQGYCEYTFGFLESDWEEVAFSQGEAAAAPIAKRATSLYLRCMNYGLKLLGENKWRKLLMGDLATFEKEVRKSNNVEGLFFTALGLASAINLNRDDIEMVGYLPFAKAMFERVVQKDPKFYKGSAQMALGMLYTGQGAAIGGDPAKGREYFLGAIEATGGRFLMAKVLFAKNYGTITNDRKFFRDTLVEVLNTAPSIWPEERLANELAHIRARRYLAHEKEWF